MKYTTDEYIAAFRQLNIAPHHLRQLSEINAKYQVDSIQDLRPVCPNCHAIIHMKNPPFTIEEIKSFIANQKNKKC